MRYRKMDANGDYSFGGQQADFHRDTPEAVAQAVKTRLMLLRGEWFLDTSEGMPWRTEVLGKRFEASYDGAIRERILGTPGVTGIAEYSSRLDAESRALAVAATISTLYGTAIVQAAL
ncbi:hypothetical protein LMG3458_04690 [Achromobacter deleyi]|jgi:hypothetical protein|uniref:Uncharacterized protein n=1 Tax=Achromobacter deleyi TaxID=1353891 RepID=A0A6S7AG26_9BURK|nr:hypothetical protein [Achromobacter deleyi]CAB3729315.1 hypothetical protein LMG3458_04690 [Achromobacter deleyi]CAB3841298.1 hypothetical protein LMG3412_01261 [Achromobacter deleyi]CAB3864216.1 hypothetical protein LMG3481_02417 [Achromobacter deleyi]CAB3906200.1 hypothetical protein LMG3482_04569 [Achromobacter deleyi]